MNAAQNECVRARLWQLYTIYDTDDSGTIELGEFTQLVTDLICVHQQGEDPSEEQARASATKILSSISTQKANVLSWNEFLASALLVLEDKKSSLMGSSPFDSAEYPGLGYVLLNGTSQILQQRRDRRQRERDAKAGAVGGEQQQEEEFPWTFDWKHIPASARLPQGLETRFSTNEARIPNKMQVKLRVMAEGTGFSPNENRDVLLWANRHDTLKEVCEKLLSGDSWPGVRGRQFRQPQSARQLSLWHKGRQLDSALTVERAGIFARLRSDHPIPIHVRIEPPPSSPSSADFGAAAPPAPTSASAPRRSVTMEVRSSVKGLRSQFRALLGKQKAELESLQLQLDRLQDELADAAASGETYTVSTESGDQTIDRTGVRNAKRDLASSIGDVITKLEEASAASS
jgi:hypothetical protein